MAVKWIKTGTDSKKLAQQEEILQKQRQDSYGKLFRFSLDAKEDARITFVDGDLNEEGFLIPPRWYEHNLCINGKWHNFFVCPALTNPELHDSCPICESGDKPSLVSAFTIIDHRSFKSNSSEKVYKDTKKLLIAKSQTAEMLAKIAQKRGGLVGACFDVSRATSKDAAVGSMFDFIEKKPIAELRALYMKETTDPKTNQTTKATYFTPADYEYEIAYRSGDELRKQGLGKPSSSGMNPGGENVQGKAADYSNQL